jgi:hypothetical protein
VTYSSILRRQYDSPKRLSNSTGLHGITFQKMILFCRTSSRTGSEEDGIRKFNNVTRRRRNEKEKTKREKKTEKGVDSKSKDTEIKQRKGKGR